MNCQRSFRQVFHGAGLEAENQGFDCVIQRS